jgi:Rieske Fe-S protein
MIIASALISLSVVGADELLNLVSSNPVPMGTSLQTSVQTSIESASSSSQTRTASLPPPGYVFVASLSALTSRSSAYFTHPSYGQSILINLSGQWKAFSATCTHAPCTVEYPGSTIYCPCHGGTFNPANGTVLGGPPPRALPEFGVLVQNGSLYVSSAVVN